jgi:hypothetical protein
MQERTFKKILIVCVILVIVIFCVYNYMEYRKNKKLNAGAMFPPWPSKCPDYWKVGPNNTCINVNRIGKCRAGVSVSDQTMDFGQGEFKGKDGMYKKCVWSSPQLCDTPWEGIDSLCV